MEDRTFEKCFIAAPANLNVTPLLSLLESKGISASDVYSVWNDKIVRSIERRIEDSDFLIAILSQKVPDANVLYEIGFARGVKKPIFLVVQKIAAIPTFLMHEFYVRASLADLNLISGYLDHFLVKHKKGVKTQKRKSIRRLAKFTVPNMDRRLENIKAHGTGIQFLSFVDDLFRSQGFVVDRSSGPRDTGVDMSVWIDSLESSFGNPILVELKIGNLNEQMLKKAEQQMRGYLSKTNSRSGLLIYLDRQGHRFNPSRLQSPLVIRFDICELVEKLVSHPIENILLDQRNKVAHGM